MMESAVAALEAGEAEAAAVCLARAAQMCADEPLNGAPLGADSADRVRSLEQRCTRAAAALSAQLSRHSAGLATSRRALDAYQGAPRS